MLWYTRWYILQDGIIFMKAFKLKSYGEVMIVMMDNPDMAAGSMFSSCCRYRSFLLFRCSRFFTLPCFKEMSMNVRPPNVINISRRLPRHTQIAHHYVKAKERKGPSLRSWLIFGGACVTGAVGVIVFIGEVFANSTKPKYVYCQCSTYFIVLYIFIQ